MNTASIPVIPWQSSSTQSDWQVLQDHFGYIAIELLAAVEIPSYFKREGWDDCILKIIGTSSLQEIRAQRAFLLEGMPTHYEPRGVNFYRVVAE